MLQCPKRGFFSVYDISNFVLCACFEFRALDFEFGSDQPLFSGRWFRLLLFFVPSGHGGLELEANRIVYEVVRRLAGQITNRGKHKQGATCRQERAFDSSSRDDTPRCNQREGERSQDAGVGSSHVRKVDPAVKFP
jgi:hypothetical protein